MKIDGKPHRIYRRVFGFGNIPVKYSNRGVSSYIFQVRLNHQLVTASYPGQGWRELPIALRRAGFPLAWYRRTHSIPDPKTVLQQAMIQGAVEIYDQRIQ